MSKLVNAEVKSGNRRAVLASNYTLQLRIREHIAGMKCDLKGIKHCLHFVWLAQDSKYKSYLKRIPHSTPLRFLAISLSKIKLLE